jgi:DNA-binding NarL/FixJ family response regulator
MNLNRRVAPQHQGEFEIVLSIERPDTEVLLEEGEETPTIAISIVSNSHLLGEGLLSLLSPHLSLQLIGSYSGAFRINSPLPNPAGHVVLLDSSVGHTVAIAWTRHWRALIPPAFVLILELANDNTLILACIEAGASGYTLEGASAVELAEAIKDVRCGKAHCSPEVTAQLYARVASLGATVVQRSVSPLTTRESEILRHIATGYTNLEIAAHLVIELRTVKQHVHNILGKLNSRSRGEAVRFAAEQGWLGENVATPLS